MKKKFMGIISIMLSVFIASCGAAPINDINDNTDTDNTQTESAIEASFLSSGNLMEKITARQTASMEADSDFIFDSAGFALELFKKTADAAQNTMISPLSVLLALSMTANGANGSTLSQIEDLLASGLPIDEMNKYYLGYLDSLKSTEKAKLSIANSIWFCSREDSIQVNEDFLQTNADYYKADAYGSPFDEQTLADINNWVSENTDGMIDGILDQIPEEAVMYLINAMAFDAEWEKVYSEDQVFDDIFHGDRSDETVSMMRSQERSYLDDGKGTGFIKPYAGGQYSFIALLPNEGITIQEYIAGMTGESFIKTISNAKSGIVYATLPRFTSEYKIELNGALTGLGMKDAFDPSLADFSRLGRSAVGNIFISSILHKTYVSVDELGTRAGAVTSVEMSVTGMPAADFYTVTLNRPFVYAVVDNNTNLPLFIGSVLSVEN